MIPVRDNPFEGIGLGIFSIAAKAKGMQAVALHLLSVVAFLAVATGIIWVGLFGCLLSFMVAAVYGNLAAIGVLAVTAAAGLLCAYFGGRLLFD